MSIFETEQFFSENSPLRKVSRDDGICYEVRAQQVRMAHEIAVAFDERQHLCIEAPTGVGKTFAYLVPAIHYALETKLPVVISTHTINLQEQILKKDLPLLNRLLEREISYSVGKGRSNYLCLRRLSKIADLDLDLFSDPAVTAEINQLLNWAEQSDSGDYSQMDSPVSGTLWQAVCCERGNCLAKQCPFFSRCFLFRARRKLASSQIIIANHAFFFSSLAMRDGDADKQDGLTLLPKFTAVVLDEGHTLEDTAATHLGLKAETFVLKHLLNRLYLDERRPRLLSGDEFLAARKAVNELRAQAELFFTRLLDWILAQSTRLVPLRYTVPNHISNYLDSGIHNLASELDRLVENGTDSPDMQQEFKVIRKELMEQNHILNQFFSMEQKDYVYWFERQGKEGRELSFQCVPIEIGPRLKEMLFENTEHFPVVITSATLAIAGDISFFQKRIGLQGAKTVVLDTPFDFKNQVKLYLGETLPAPDAKEFSGAAEKHLRHFLTLTRGRAFVLFTSYDALNRAAEILFATAGSDLISVHIEPAYDHAAVLARIRSLGKQNGIVLNPATPATAIEPLLAQVDLVLLMTVQPGFGGQSFRHEVLPKVEQIARWRRERSLSFRIEIDGGVDEKTVPLCLAAGADTFVAGTAFYRAADRVAFRRLIEG